MDNGFALDVELVLFEHPVLELVHRGPIAAAHAAAVFTLLATASTSVFTRVEMSSAEVGGCVVVGAVRLAVATSFAAAEEVALSGCILADPDFANRGVVSFDVSSEFMFAVKALRLFSTELTEGCLTRRLLSSGSSDLCLVLYCTVFAFDCHNPWLRHLSTGV